MVSQIICFLIIQLNNEFIGYPNLVTNKSFTVFSLCVITASLYLIALMEVNMYVAGLLLFVNSE